MHISSLKQELNKVTWQRNETYRVLELHDVAVPEFEQSFCALASTHTLTWANSQPVFRTQNRMTNVQDAVMAESPVAHKEAPASTFSSRSTKICSVVSVWDSCVNTHPLTPLLICYNHLRSPTNKLTCGCLERPQTCSQACRFGRDARYFNNLNL